MTIKVETCDGVHPTYEVAADVVCDKPVCWKFHGGRSEFVMDNVNQERNHPKPAG